MMQAMDGESMKGKRSKRGDGDGNYRQRPDGLWEVRFTLPNGKRKSLYGKTRREVQEKHRMALRDVEQGIDLSARKQTVGQFLDRWLADVVKPSKSAKTSATYADIVRLHVIPELGRISLDKLTPQHVAALLKAKSDAGLSARTVHHIRAVLRTALNQAVRWGLVGRNVAALVASPRQQAHDVRPLTAMEARAVLKAADGDRFAALFRIGLALGLRQGEILGLRWVDVNLTAGTLRVTQALQRIDGKLILKEPKTEKSRRTLRLPRSVAEALRTHRDRQAFERAAAGERWTESGLVFTSTIGTPLDPRNVLRAWHGLLAKTDVERRPFHSSRHTAASLLLAEGVPVKIVQEVLGHSLLSTTADIYGHLFPQAFAEAADAMDRALAANE